jgi:prefoldin subunit 5
LAERDRDSGHQSSAWAKAAADIERLGRENDELRQANEHLTNQLRDALQRIERLEEELSSD